MATIQVTNSNIEDTLADHGVVILDFWAEWCPPCRNFGPIFEEASEKYPDIAFGKVDVDAEEDLAQRYSVRQIPTIVAIKGGQVVHTQVGALMGSAFDQFVEGIRNLG